MWTFKSKIIDKQFIENALKLLSQANDELSQKNYEGLSKACNTFKALKDILKKIGDKKIKALSKSALNNAQIAKELFEAAESNYSHKFQHVQTWKNQRSDLNMYLSHLYEDYTKIKDKLESLKNSAQ